jgi:hypothetical protein
MTLQHLLNVLVQIASKVGNKKSFQARASSKILQARTSSTGKEILSANNI